MQLEMAMQTPSSSLKRKRPPMIHIPNVLCEIQDTRGLNSDALPPTAAVSLPGVGVYSVKGKKKFMEDTHKILSFSTGASRKGFYGVYDGHGGKRAADFVADNLHSNILEKIETCKGNTEKKEGVRQGFLKTDEEFLQLGVSSGACCITAVIEEKEIVISNLGDCRAVLCRGGLAVPLSTDHRAAMEDERRRIENAGGYVEYHRGAWRVHGVLSVSRSIGDAHLKDWVLAEPDTRIVDMCPDMEYLILASDGLWEEVGNQEAADLVKLCLANKKVGPVGDLWKVNADQYGCVSTSPSSKSRRISLVKQQEPLSQSPSPSHKKAFVLNEFEDKFAYENEGPPSKKRKLPKIKQQELVSQSPSRMNAVDWNELEEDKFPCENERPLLQTLELSRIEQQELASESPSYKKAINRIKLEDKFANENEGPSLEARKISKFKRKPICQSPNQENIGYCPTPTPSGLAAACKELVNLALKRGSLDDITVMLIDLKHFRCSN